MISVYRINAFGSFKPRPSDFQYILSPFSAMWCLEREYDLYDGTYIWQGRTFDEYEFVPKRKSGYGYQGSRYSHPNRIWTLTEKLLRQGDLIVYDSTHGWDSGNPFYIDEEGDLVKTDNGFYNSESYYHRIISAYREILNTDLAHGYPKPAPTVKQRIYYGGSSAPVEQHAQAAKVGKTINSKAAGRLLAAGGVYNGNIEGFRQTAEQLGGDAIKGFDQTYNQTTAGIFMAGMSLLALKSVAKVSTYEQYSEYLGKYKGEPIFMKDMQVKQIDYLRRSREEYTAMRRAFDNGIRSDFMKSISNHPDVVKTFDQANLQKITNGGVPSGWNVHHKIPLDDGGDNSFSNLILIQNSPYHSALTKTQRIVTKNLEYGNSSTVLWPMPQGVIYPKP